MKNRYSLKYRFIILLASVVVTATLFPLGWASYTTISTIDQQRSNQIDSHMSIFEKPIAEALLRSDSLSLSRSVSKICNDLSMIACVILNTTDEVIFSFPFNLKSSNEIASEDRNILYSGKKLGSIRVFWKKNSISEVLISNVTPLLLFSLLLISFTMFISKLLFGSTIDGIQKLITSQKGQSLDKILSNLEDINSPVLEISTLTEELHTQLSTIQKFEKSEKSNVKARAIAQTTQMFAHDVRKPFSMIKSLLSILQSTKDPSKIQKLITSYTPEVEKSISAVNGMISDIMEIGSSSKHTTEVLDPKNIIVSSIKETFKFDRKSDINFNYQLTHRFNVNANQLKLSRAFLNIISNASQAMKGKGEIWFKTKDIKTEESKFIEFTIGNNGSFIPQEEIENLFEAFYTKGKKSGTGLGLAIAKKVIESHGGQISCSSSKELGVEFVFTVPAADRLNGDNKEVCLASSQEIASSIDPVNENQNSSPIVDPRN